MHESHGWPRARFPLGSAGENDRGMFLAIYDLDN